MPIPRPTLHSTPHMRDIAGNNDVNNKSPYGALYNWYAVNTGKLAPKGWHVPTYTEWGTLITYLGGISAAGGNLKEVGLAHWLTPNGGATNEAGFTALPGGCRFSSYSSFDGLGETGRWASSTVSSTPSSICLLIDLVNANAQLMDAYFATGLSVRCIQG